jgi:hypothetical protein
MAIGLPDVAHATERVANSPQDAMPDATLAHGILFRICENALRYSSRKCGIYAIYAIYGINDAVYSISPIVFIKLRMVQGLHSLCSIDRVVQMNSIQLQMARHK